MFRCPSRSPTVGSQRQWMHLLLFAWLLSASPIFSCSVLAATGKGTEAGASPASQVVPAPRQLVDEAKSAYHASNFQLAATLLRQALKIAPKDADTRILLGRLLLQLGDPSSSERELRQALRDGGPTHQALTSLFQTLLKRNEAQALLNEFAEPAAAAKSLSDADILEGRAQALLALGRLDDAKVAAKRALSIHRSVSAFLILAQVALKQGDREAANSLVDEAIKLNRNDGHALLTKLDLLMSANNNVEALSVAERILRLFPNDLATRALRIDILLRLKQEDKAKRALSALHAMAPGSPISQYYQAILLSRAGKSIDAWRIAQALPPNFTRLKPTYALEVSRIAVQSGNIESGASILGAALAKYPDSVDLRLALAEVRMSQSGPEAALSALAPLRDTTDSRVLDLLIQANLKLQKYDVAVVELKRMNNPAHTVSLLTPILKLEPGAIPLMDAIAMAKLQMRDARGSVELLRRAHQLNATDGEITFHLVQALDASGDRRAAKELLTNLLSSGSTFVDRPLAQQLATNWR